MTEETPKRQKSSSNTVPADRISALPESLISYILSSLPTKDAVATSILSRSWRFRWTKVTTFLFVNTGNGDESDDERSENQVRGNGAVQTTDFVDSVNMVLLRHSGESIDKFLLRWESPVSRSTCLFIWASLAIARHVRVLDLDLKTPDIQDSSTSTAQCEFHLPSSLYTSGTLEVLKLEGLFGVKPPNVVCLSKLVEMHLVEAIYESDEAMNRLISGCPVLEDLVLVRVNKMDNLAVCRISSPSLKCLYVYFHEDAEGVGDMKLIIDTPALEMLTLLDEMSSHISIQRQLTSAKRVEFTSSYLAPSMIVPLLQTFASVKYLFLYSYSMMEMESWPAEVSFKKLAKLTIGDIQWTALMDLLDACSSTLEELVILCDGDPWSEPDRVPRCFLSGLRRVSFRIHDSQEDEMMMLKFFLDHCLVTERVDICCKACAGESTGDEAKRLKLLKTVCKLPRVSPACKIFCLEASAFKRSVE